jgi:hypothetical protein
VNVLGRAARGWMPQCVRKRVLDMLFERTAAAFGQPVPPLRGLSAEQTLQAFAEFTAHAAGTTAPRSLFEVGFVPGRWLRRAFGVASTQDVMDAARVVYRVLGIDFAGDSDGEITISQCFFSRVYPPSVCRVMSALDAGLLAGLSGGRQLVFSQRITDGYPCCRAVLAS